MADIIFTNAWVVDFFSIILFYSDALHYPELSNTPVALIWEQSSVCESRKIKNGSV